MNYSVKFRDIALRKRMPIQRARHQVQSRIEDEVRSCLIKKNWNTGSSAQSAEGKPEREYMKTQS